MTCGDSSSDQTHEMEYSKVQLLIQIDELQNDNTSLVKRATSMQDVNGNEPLYPFDGDKESFSMRSTLFSLLTVNLT